MISHSKPLIGKKEIESIAAALKSGQVGYGKEAQLFEKEFARFLGVKYAFAVNSGSSALHLALLGLGIRRGDRVALPTYTCAAVLNSINYVGARPILVDVARTGNIAPFRNKNANAVIVPHMFGIPAPVDLFDAPVIEDCAMSLGAKYGGRMLGTFGEVGVTSFYATKLLTTGVGGMVFTNKKAIAERIKDLINYDNRDDYAVRYNYGMDALSAALGKAQLKRFPEFLKRRREIAELYNIELGDLSVELPPKAGGNVYYRYCLYLAGRDTGEFMKHMRTKGVEVKRPVYKPLHMYFNNSKAKYPQAEKLYKHLVSLPIYPALTDSQAKKVASAVKSYFTKATFIMIFLLAALNIYCQQTEEKQKIRVRFLDNSARMGRITNADEYGITFEDAETGITVKFKWEELAKESAQEIRESLFGKKPEEVISKEVATPATRIKLKDGAIKEGIIDQRHSDDKTIVIKNAEGTYAYNASDVAAKEDITLHVLKVYTPEELYKIMFDKVSPADAGGYEKLGKALVEAGLPDRAEVAYKISFVLKRPEVSESRIYRDLIHMRDFLEDISLKELVYHAQEQYLLGDYEKALNQVDIIERKAEESNISISAEVTRIKNELNALRETSLDQRIIAEWYHTIESLLMTKASDRGLDYGTAINYVKDAMPKEVEKIVAGKFNFSPDDKSIACLWVIGGVGARFKFSYDEITWLIDKDNWQDVEKWWQSASADQRYKLLKGLYIEKNMTVLKTLKKSCPTCGGTGEVDKRKFHEATAGICPSCHNLKYYRSLIYR